MFVPQVQDTKLYNTRVRLGETTFEEASIYPFFRQTGEVVLLMLVLPLEPRVFMIPYTKGIVKVPFWGPIRVGLTTAQLNPFEMDEKKGLKGLFHYDKGWVLEEEQFLEYRPKDIIRDTNCANAVRELAGKEIGHLRFSRDMSRLISFAISATGVKVSAFEKADRILALLYGTISEKEGPESVGSRQSWQLDPAWRTWAGARSREWRFL